MRLGAIFAALSLGAGACTLDFDPRRLRDGGSDGPCDLGRPFEAPQYVPGIYTAAYDGDATLSFDELELYIDDYVAGGQMFVSRRNDVNEAFGPRAELATLNHATANDYSPMLGLDDKTLVFASDRSGAFALYRAARPQRGEPFGPPEPMLDLGVAPESAHLTADNKGVWLTVRESNGKLDLYYADAVADGFGPARSVAELNTPVTDTGPVPDTDNTVVFFGSNRADPTLPRLDIWMARRSEPDRAFEPPTLVTELNTPDADEWPSWLSPDGCRLYLTSNRSGDYEVLVARRPR